MSNLNNEKINAVKEISIKELVSIVYRRIWLVIILVIICTLFAYFRTNDNTPVYQSTSRIIIEGSEEQTKTLQVIMRDVTVLDKVVKELNLSNSPESIAGNISVASIEGSQVVGVTVTHSDPNLAANIANTTVKVFIDEMKTTFGFGGVHPLSQAKVNNVPINSNENSTIIKAGLVGLVVGIGLTFLIDAFDYRIRKQQEIEEYVGIPAIGQVSKINKKNIKSKNKRKKNQTDKLTNKKKIYENRDVR